MPKHIPLFPRICLVSSLALCAVSPASAQQKPERNYSYSEEATPTLEQYGKESALPNKDLGKILTLLEDGLGKVKNKTSYDYAMLLQLKAKTLIEKGDYAKSIEPMEQGLILSDAQNPTFLDERVGTEVSHFLAQLYFQEATALKDLKLQKQYFEKAELYIERWYKTTKTPTEEGMFFYASLLYGRAIQDDKNIDKKRVERSLEFIEKCLHLSTRPKDNLYLLKLACFQQLERTAESAAIFELLIQRKPESKEYWKQLAGTYMALEQPVRAIITLERAQKLGLLNTPTDNYSIFGIYFNEGQFEQAAELLEKGLKEKTIDTDEKTWELLASCYQQLNRDFKAIDALKRATQLFPKSGQLDFLIAQNYYQMKKLDDALLHLQMSIRKGGGTKPAQTYLLMAYIAFELKKLDIALDAANKAIALPDGVKEGTRFKKALEDAIADREEKLKNQKI